MNFDDYLVRIKPALLKSNFRKKFHLTKKEVDYIKRVGLDNIEAHASLFIEKRLAKEYIANDGKQTPYYAHPVFTMQHKTATCCRGCLEKWHHIQKGRALTLEEQSYIKRVIMDMLICEYRINQEKDGENR